ncbi:hypothetical protein LCY76_22875 [Fictibacillus sp. KIGAM418]|uniref:Aminoacyl-transfer RNA synthetases class-II family profile domain-containing protein n=1 Tax=Fictibacillus marinisediminis TaxID=2878389 RepID=A0A9X1XGU4_9BACL|nr:aminoacyl--tRNA ligase-related protein [Fictibacillus marinisediminis]MCK6259418.1 hypothetical protein [Fictibacillus marinisediminis]
MLLYIPLKKLNTNRERVLGDLENLYYLSESILHIEVNDQMLIVDTLNHREVKKQIKRYFTQPSTNPTLKQKVLEDNTMHIPSYHSSFVHSSTGAILTGDSSFLEEAFDRLICQIAKKHHVVFKHYPSFLSNKSMHVSGYAKCFPQRLYRLSEIPHEFDILTQYRKLSQSHQDTNHLFKTTDHFLQPCICYHVYEELASQSNPELLQLYSAKGRCYRHEHPHRLSPTRLQEFTMREIVFVGSDKDVKNVRMQLLSDVWDLFEDLGLRGYLTTSNDPFFLHENQDKKFYQIADNTKYEIIFSPNEDIHVSIASGNHCGTMLCDAFQLNKESPSLFSGCVAFGLDRWVQAFLYHYGSDKKGWPSLIRNLIV